MFRLSEAKQGYFYKIITDKIITDKIMNRES
jgi:hypothetical protein